MQKVVKTIFTIIILTICKDTVHSYVDKIALMTLSYKSNTVFFLSYSLDPLGSSKVVINTSYEGFYLNFTSRYFGEVEIMNLEKQILGNAVVYDFFVEVGYENTLYGNFHYLLSLMGKYEYFHLFSEVYLGGSLGIGFRNDVFHLLTSIKILESFVFEGIGIYDIFSKDVFKLGAGCIISLQFQDFFGFVSSRIFRYENLSMDISSGVYYGLLKGLCPFFKGIIEHNNFSISYAISFQENLGIFQFWCFEVKI
ncbi:MAG: hypothetical protein ABDH28_07740 [Brevinematia bacterium]